MTPRVAFLSQRTRQASQDRPLNSKIVWVLPCVELRAWKVDYAFMHGHLQCTHVASDTVTIILAALYKRSRYFLLQALVAY